MKNKAIGMKLRISKHITTSVLMCLLLTVMGCQGSNPDQWKIDTMDPRKARGPNAGKSIFGGEGLQLFGNKRDQGEAEGSAGIGVNSHLWRASLDTISFMPLTSADPFGGVIITDWYSPPEKPSERFKMTIYILTRTLRADGLKVAVFRQKLKESGVWIEESITPSTISGLENKILERARQLRTGSPD